MPNVDFNFQGWIRGANITEAQSINGDRIDVSKMSPVELSQKLENGVLVISLGPYLYGNHSESEIELFDFDHA